MKKEAIITVRGLQPEVDPANPIEVISTGTYQKKDDTHYLFYEEADEVGKITKNRIKITPDSLEMSKTGGVTTQLFFRKGEKKFACYETPFGEFMLGMTTNYLETSAEEESLTTRLVYRLEVNGEHVSDCELDIDVRVCRPSSAADGVSLKL